MKHEIITCDVCKQQMASGYQLTSVPMATPSKAASLPRDWCDECYAKLGELIANPISIDGLNQENSQLLLKLEETVAEVDRLTKEAEPPADWTDDEDDEGDEETT